MAELLQTNQKLQVTIKSPLALLYKGEATAVTLTNDRGKFDILPLHANFISLIKDMVIIHETVDSQKDIKIEEGIAKVFENTVDIFIGIKTIS